MEIKLRFAKLLYIAVILSSIIFTQTTIANAKSLSDVPDGYIGIYTAEDLNNIRNNLKGKYILMNNIDLSSYSQGKGWEPIIKYIDKDKSLKFKGILDGNGYAIKNLKINRPNIDNVGLFYSIENTAKVSNLRIEDANIIGRNLVGCLTGSGSGEITSCYIEGNIKGDSFVGGFVGRSLCSIKNCSTSGSVTGSGSYVSSITGSSSAYAIENCSTTAKVIGSTGTLIGGMITQQEGGWWYNVYNDKAELYWYTGRDRNITIPSALPLNRGYVVTRIGPTAFAGNQLITSVNIPNTVKEIGQGAFANCRNLKNINIPDSIKSIEDDTFSNCSSLKNISIPISIEKIGREAFEGSGLNTLRVPNSVKNIGWQAFGYCKNLKSISLSDNLEKIEGNTFSGCSSLKNITIPNNVKSIGLQAFINCSSLESITIKNANTNIFDCAYTITNNENPYLRNEKVVIKGKVNSKGKAYAEKYDRSFVVVP